jgi:hypothetical protein
MAMNKELRLACRRIWLCNEQVREQPHLSTKPEKTKTLRSAELPRPKFDLGKDDHALYGEYNPKFAGRGGEHLVFTIPGHEKIVFKVAHNMIVATLHDVESREGSGGVLAERTLRHQAVVARAKLADIEEFFGREHMARQRVSTMNLPIPAHILRDLYNEDLLPSGQDSVTLPVVVRIQEAIDLRERETLLDLTSSYAEDFKNLKDKTYNVKLRVVGNSHAISIPKEIVEFIQHHEKVMDNMVRLCFEDMHKLSLIFGEKDQMEDW